jgi:serine/threonine-protein kinase
MIDRTRWQQLSALLDDVLALPPGERVAWLAALRRREPELAAQIEPMLGTGYDDPDATEVQPRVELFEQHLAPALIGPGEAAAAAALAPRAGQRMGPWELLYPIGAGGMGEVWLARRADGLFEAQAAIKLLRSDLPAAGLAARFARERAVLARLNHPAVARLLDAGIAEGQAYLVLEYVVGRSLTAHVRTDCPTVAERVRLLVRVADAVDHAHAQLIVHRDLKPSNVMVTASGEPKLLDFGIAGLLDDGEPVDTDLTRQTGRGLTLGYAAPEQVLGGPIGTAADVFSLGVMLYELLTGELPFAPRHSPRVAIERAVLHDEPQRFQAVLGLPAADTQDDPSSPGRPVDAQRAVGDLEAVVAKALRKNAAERYGSVQAFVDDLQRWLSHRPVSVKRDDWRHRAGLWLRRHAVLTGATALVVLSLSAGLVAATWQWRRADAAARQSDQVTTYLSELLASASPSRHGGQWPNVLQLLDSSRKTLPDKFNDDPETKIRLLQVLAETYHGLSRFDAAFPLFDELVELNERLHGPDDSRSLLARLGRAGAWTAQGSFDKGVAELEALRGPLRERFGPQSAEQGRLLRALGGAYTRTGRLPEAEQVLEEAGRITERLYAPGSLHWLAYQNDLQVLRTTQGRFREGLDVLMRTQPYWARMPMELTDLKHTLQRNTVTVQIRLGEYAGVEERIGALLAEGDRLRGPGNEWSMLLRGVLVGYLRQIGQPARALAVADDNLERTLASTTHLPATLLPLRATQLLLRGQAHAASPASLAADARALLAETRTQRQAMGYPRAEAWIDLVRVGLLLDDAALAGEALALLKTDAGLNLARDSALHSRVTYLDGELARLRGELPRSKQLLQQRMALFERIVEKRVVPAWVASLDLAYTLVLMRDPGAAEALAQAAARRPGSLPAGHPLDAVQAYLESRLAHGDDAAAPVRAAITGLARVQQRRADDLAAPGRGSLAGALF